MSTSRQLTRAIAVLTIVATAVSVLVIAIWFVTSPRHYISVVLLVGSQTQSDPAAIAYVQAFPGTNQIAGQIAASPAFSQIKTVAEKSDPEGWLQSHIHVRRINNDRIEIIAAARSREATPRDLDAVIILAADALVADAASNGLHVEVISRMRSGG